LRVAGIWPNPSTVDWPGKLVGVVYTQGCSFDCVYCHNHPLIPFSGGRPLSPEELVAEVEETYLGMVEGIVITGGEPTLQPDLADHVKALSDAGYEVGVDTNGANPRAISSVLGSVSRVALDLKAPLPDYPRVVRRPVSGELILETFRLLNDWGRGRPPWSWEVRTTVAPPLVGRQEVLEIADLLAREGFSGTFVVQAFRRDGTRPEASFLREPTVEELVGIAREAAERSGIEVFVRSRLGLKKISPGLDARAASTGPA